MTPEMGKDRGYCLSHKMRTFAESQENVSGDLVKARGLSEDDVSEFLFDDIGLKVENCLDIALRTS